MIHAAIFGVSLSIVALCISLLCLWMTIRWKKTQKIQRKQLIYLAGPYSSPDEFVRLGRFDALNAMAGRLMGLGFFIYSPISHTHPIATAGSLPLGWDFWEQYDRVILGCCERLLVYKLPGWEESKGVAAEIEIAKELGLPIDYIEYISGSL